MAFNNMNSGLSGRYARPMQLLQQIDFSAVPMSSYSDLANLMDVNNAPQSNPSSHHISPPVEHIVTNDNNRSMTGDYSSGRPASDFCMPSISTIANTTSVQGLPGHFSQHFHHFPNQMLLPDSSYQPSNSKMPNFTKPWYNNNQQNTERTCFTNEATAPEREDESAKPRRGRKPSKNKKEKKEKMKRVRYIKPGCSGFCRRRCKQKISQSAREDLFNKYWNLEDDSKKKEFIAENAIKMPMMKCKEGSRRSFSVDWAFSINGESFSVCKLFFLHTLDIPENTAYAAIKDSKFFNNDTPIIKGKAQEKTKIKSTWFETDLDDYSSTQKKGKSSTGARSESFSKNEKFHEMRPGCTNVCRRNCQSKFTHEERLALFNEYRSLSNIRKQRDYISKFIHRMERKRVRAGESTRRACSIQWVLPVKGKEIHVCKTFFLHTIGISERAAYNIGLQNEIQPVERVVKRPRQQKSQTPSGKHLSFGSIIAKGKLKSALKLSRSRKKKKKVESDFSDTEDDVDDEHYFDSWKETSKKREKKVKKKVAKKRGRKRKKHLDKTVRFKKLKTADNFHEEESSENEIRRTKSDSSSSIKISSTLFNLPIKKRGNLKQRVPSLKIRKSDIFPSSGKKRNPYKRKEMPSKTSYPICPENCRKKCRQSVSAEARKHIFEEFWSLENMEEQRKYIANCVKRIAKPTCACLVASHLRGKRRGYSISWSLTFRGLDVPVCKTFFMHVLQVSDSVVYKAVREDESFTADLTPQPCKHFTGQYKAPKVSAVASSQEKKTNDHSMEKTTAVEEPDISACEINNTGNSDEEKLPTFGLEKPNDSDIEMQRKDQNIVDKHTKCNPEHPQAIEASIIPRQNMNLNNFNLNNQSMNIDRQNALHVQKVNSNSHNVLCDIGSNYETLIPNLANDHSQDSSQALPVHFPNLQMNPYGSGGKFRNSLNLPQEHVPINSNQVEMWPKHMENFHTVFGSNHSVFPSLPDNRMDHVHSIPHPQDLPPSFSFPQNSNHQVHMPVQGGSMGHHPPSFPQLQTDMPNPRLNHPSHMSVNSDMINSFYHNPRFHNLSAPVGLPRDYDPDSAEYSMNGDNQAYHDSLLMQTLKNTSSDMFPSKSKTPKARKRKKKPSSSRPKPEKKEPKGKKRREKKPFTKHVKAGCSLTCKRKCLEKIPQGAREQIFNDFWNLENDTQRREFVLPIVRKVPKKTCSGVTSRRCCTIEWAVPFEEKLHIVCKRFFLDTFDIGEKFVKTVFDKVEHKGGSMEDLRGRHCKRSNFFMKEQEEIDKHIRSVSTLKAFQCLSCKKDFTRWCLDPGIVVSQLYKMYADQRRLEGKKPACRTSYTDLCTKKFNLKGNPSLENVCDACIKITEENQNFPSTSNVNLE